LPDGGARARLGVAVHPDHLPALRRAAAALEAPGRWRPCGPGWLRRDDARATLGERLVAAGDRATAEALARSLDEGTPLPAARLAAALLTPQHGIADWAAAEDAIWCCPDPHDRRAPLQALARAAAIAGRPELSLDLLPLERDPLARARLGLALGLGLAAAGALEVAARVWTDAAEAADRGCPVDAPSTAALIALADARHAHLGPALGELAWDRALRRAAAAPLPSDLRRGSVFGELWHARSVSPARASGIRRTLRARASLPVPWAWALATLELEAGLRARAAAAADALAAGDADAAAAAALLRCRLGDLAGAAQATAAALPHGAGPDPDSGPLALQLVDALLAAGAPAEALWLARATPTPAIRALALARAATHAVAMGGADPRALALEAFDAAAAAPGAAAEAIEAAGAAVGALWRAGEAPLARHALGGVLARLHPLPAPLWGIALCRLGRDLAPLGAPGLAAGLDRAWGDRLAEMPDPAERLELLLAWLAAEGPPPQP